MTVAGQQSLSASTLAVLLLGACSSGGGPTPPRVTASIVVAGDIADCGSLPASASGAAETAAIVSAQDVLVLTLGDSTYPIGAPNEFTGCFQPTWGAFKDRIRPTAGNHEYYTAGASGYFGYFGAQAGPDRRGYYSFDLDGWHFISLNSNIEAGPGSPQYEWLVADLSRAASGSCTVAYWHHPVFSSGPHGDVPQMKEAFAALHSAGVEIVLSGHDHTYERFAPQDANGVADPARGIRTFVVGTGGAGLYGFEVARPNSEVRYNATHGVLRLLLRTDGYDWQFVPAGGGTPPDTGSGSCH